MSKYLNKKSSLLTVIACLIIISSLSSAFFINYITDTVRVDAEITNKLGIIRGSIQRLIQLEIAGIQSDDLIEDIEDKILDFDKNRIEIYDEKNQIQEAVKGLLLKWEPLKKEIRNYRSASTLKNKRKLLDLSEDIWLEANDMVLTSQVVSENKISRYRMNYIFVGLNLLLGTVIIVLIYTYVNKVLEFHAIYDVLTKLHNRRYFNEALLQSLSKARRYHNDFSLIFLDIDHFKKVNDVYGHDKGDSVLIELSDLLKNGIRESDIIARIGGEEFCIIAEKTDIDQAYILAEKIRKKVYTYDFETVDNITISLGITSYLENDDNVTIYKRADDALYKAKENGRNRSEKNVGK